MKNTSPAFQYYPTNFLADPKTIVMSAEEIGAYWLLISACWVEGQLPNDLDELATIARTPLNKFKTMWEKRIKRCFVFVEKSNTFFHQELLKEIKKQKAFRNKKIEAGKASGRKRREKKSLDPEQVFDSVQTKDEQTRTLYTISPSISLEKETTTTVVEKKTDVDVADLFEPESTNTPNVHSETSERLARFQILAGSGLAEETVAGLLDIFCYITEKQDRQTLAKEYEWIQACKQLEQEGMGFSGIKSLYRYGIEIENKEFITPKMMTDYLLPKYKEFLKKQEAKLEPKKALWTQDGKLIMGDFPNFPTVAVQNN